MRLTDIETPALVLDAAKMRANIDRMNATARRLGVALRPHLKTGKSVEVARAMTEGWSGAVTVSTLKEADEFFAAGCRDILYAVGIASNKLAHAARLTQAGAQLTLILDSVAAAEAVAAFGRETGVRLPVLIEIDSDGHRAGVQPDDAATLDAIARALANGAELAGVMTHGGGSYNSTSADGIAAHAEMERAGAVRAAEHLRAAGHACPTVSVGSTPTALFARDLAGVTELRVGVYVFFDLVMAGLGVCAPEDIAVGVLTSVIGHQAERGQLIVDAGWMALSRDRGTQGQVLDQGYGLVRDAEGGSLDDLVVVAANQEHGIVARRDGGPLDVARFPVGTLLRVLPNHACATAAQHGAYRVVDGSDEITGTWPRFGGWS
ncbi:alanine racemase [Sphingoaurantiacus capsulatus]|uniref:Alanine racemase n=1 Tax=Sphingoaurantiacus capsulatus TaxID=1771310 RepID=A0ABV7X685_9SPHN